MIEKALALVPLIDCHKEVFLLVATEKSAEIPVSDIRVDFDGFSQVILGGFVVHFCLHGAHAGDFEKALHAILFDSEAEAAAAGAVDGRENLALVFEPTKVSVFLKSEGDLSNCFRNHFFLRSF